MRIYIHQGEGHYLGASVIVIAEDRGQANEMIREALQENGLSNDEPNIIQEYSVEEEKTIYIDNGDY